MVVDYSERKTGPVNRNRPSKGTGGMLAFGFILVGAASFGLGMAADRFLVIKAAKKTAILQQAAAPQQGTPPAATAPPASAAPGAQPQKAPDQPLTFYDTLPKGGKAVLGSGLNPAMNEVAPVKPAPPAPPASPPQAAPKDAKHDTPRQPDTAPKAASPKENLEKAKQADPAPAKDATAKDATAKKPAAKGKFAVQLVATKDRKEAETIKARWAGKGFSAYIVESNVPDKGVWYRVRVGKQLEQAEANGMAAVVGKGAIVVPE